MTPKDQRVNKEFILSKVSEIDILCSYLEIDESHLGTNKFFCNTFRNDTNPTCTVKIFPDGKPFFRDWADTKGYDIFSLIQKVTNTSFNDTLNLIAKHFHLLDAQTEEDFKYIISKERLIELVKNKSNVDIKIKRIDWTKKHYEFWGQFNLTTEKDLQNIYPIKCYWYNDIKFQYDKIMFAYHFGGYDYKIYIPQANKQKGELKFLHNNSTILQGENELLYNQPLLILTSSYKDVKVLRKIEEEYGFGYEVVATMSETIAPKKEKMEFLKTKYSNILLWYNNDNAGINAMQAQATQFGIDYLQHNSNLPKDISDIVKLIDYPTAIETVHKLLYE